MGAYRDVTTPLGDLAAFRYEEWVGDPAARDVEPPKRVDLTAGPAYLIRLSEGDGSGSDDLWSTSEYLLSIDEGTLLAQCSTHDVRPEDDWLSIIETTELLSVEEPRTATYVTGTTSVEEYGPPESLTVGPPTQLRGIRLTRTVDWSDPRLPTVMTTVINVDEHLVGPLCQHEVRHPPSVNL